MDEKWEFVRKLPFGGQAEVSIVRRRGASTECVLKFIREPKHKGLERLKREVRALRNLDFDGVPKLIDDTGVHGNVPYFVMEFVRGKTLRDWLREPLSLDASLELVEAITNVVEGVHQIGVVHRDIKPNNIILRDNDHRKPVLVDFGLAVSDDESMLTEVEDQVGNRFLALPELQAPHGNKRDPRSDLTYCCGILFYALTRSQPMVLLNEKGQMPHRRARAQQQLLSQLDAHSHLALEHLLDTGFDLVVDRRFQNTSELRAALDWVRSPLEPSPLASKPKANLNTEITINANLLKMPAFGRTAPLQAIFLEFDDITRGVEFKSKTLTNQARTPFRQPFPKLHASQDSQTMLCHRPPSTLAWTKVRSGVISHGNFVPGKDCFGTTDRREIMAYLQQPLRRILQPLPML